MRVILPAQENYVMYARAHTRTPTYTKKSREREERNHVRGQSEKVDSSKVTRLHKIYEFKF